MSARERFEIAKVEQDTFRLIEEEHAVQRREANKRAADAFVDLLVEEKILSQHSWLLTVEDLGAILVCTADSSQWKELSDFAETNYHCRFSLQENDGDISFDDGTISIAVHDVNQLSALISKYGLQVTLSEHSISRKNLWKERVASIEMWEAFLSKKP